MKNPGHSAQKTLLFASLLTLAILTGCSSEHGDDDGHATGEQQTDGHDDGKGGEHKGEEGHVALTQNQFDSAGIEIVSVQPGDLSTALLLPGTITPNEDAVLHVTPRIAGQVRTVLKHLGEPVESGELLCIIDSVDLGNAAADYLLDKSMAAAAMETLDRAQELYSRRLESIRIVLDGSIEVSDRIYRREKDLRERAVSTVRPLLEAEKSLELAKLEKNKQVTELEAERDARLLELDVQLRARKIDLAAATNRLIALGIDAKQLEELTEDSPLLSGEYRVFAPGSGVVVSRHVSPGEFVAAGTKLYIVEDLSNVWFVASTFEEQLESIRTGQVANISLDAFPDTMLKGNVSFVEYRVDPTSRSVGVRITLDNEQLDSWPEEFPLRPGMFGSVELETDVRRAAVVLPEAALVHDDAGEYVFVQVEPLEFERREITFRPAAGGMVEILSGLEAAERVAASGTFLLKSAERQGELGGGHSH